MDPAPLLKLVESKDPDLVRLAAQALSQLTNPPVRRMALRWMQSSDPLREHSIDALNHNWQPGYHQTVLDWYLDETDRDMQHRFQIQLKQFWRDHPNSELEPAYNKAIYEGPCTECREFLVEALCKANSLPGWMRDESRWDANDRTRELVRETSPS